jgi:hypothetical protein
MPHIYVYVCVYMYFLSLSLSLSLLSFHMEAGSKTSLLGLQMATV